MKKYIIAAAVLMFASQSFAQAPDVSVLKGFNATKNVTIEYALGCTSGSVNNCWAASSGHSSGDKNYFTSNAYGGLAQKAVTPGDPVTAPTAPDTPTDSAIADGYTQM